MSLLIETVEVIGYAGKKTTDVAWIGTSTSREGVQYRCTWDEFAALADFDYDSGYGAQHIASDLIIVFNDGSYLDRSEYDGSEGWDYNKAPERGDPKDDVKITQVGLGMWSDLHTLHILHTEEE